MDAYTIITTIPNRLYNFSFSLIYGFILISIIDLLISKLFWFIINVEFDKINKKNINNYSKQNKYLLSKEIYNYHEKTRWFLLHSISNIIVLYYIWDEFWIGLYDFTKIYSELTDNKAYGIVIALHIYHIILYSISEEDKFHHLWFAIGGALFTIMIQPYIGTSMALITLNGIPGAIDYFLLVLVRLKYINKLVEKKINAQLNLWFRMSYSIFLSGISFASLIINKQYICFPCLGIILWNSIYYGNQSIVNAVKHEMKNNK